MADLITTKQAAEILGKTRQWIGYLCRQSQEAKEAGQEPVLECERVGRDWLISRASVEIYKRFASPGDKEKPDK